MPTTTTTSLKLDPELKARVQRLATACRRTPHWILREAVLQFVEREEKRVGFLQDAQAAWNEFTATGWHATAEEADSWLAKLEADEQVEVPECHL
ncbi:MAG: CopG family ribbon-helix-helix protein [Terracidiphilus sp.]|jgi:predicted transcriptional regulator